MINPCAFGYKNRGSICKFRVGGPHKKQGLPKSLNILMVGPPTTSHLNINTPIGPLVHNSVSLT